MKSQEYNKYIKSIDLFNVSLDKVLQEYDIDDKEVSKKSQIDTKISENVNKPSNDTIEKNDINNEMDGETEIKANETDITNGIDNIKINIINDDNDQNKNSEEVKTSDNATSTPPLNETNNLLIPMKDKNASINSKRSFNIEIKSDEIRKMKTKEEMLNAEYEKQEEESDVVDPSTITLDSLIDQLNNISIIDDDHLPTRVLLGQLYYQTKHYELAEYWLQRSVKNNKNRGANGGKSGETTYFGGVTSAWGWEGWHWLGMSYNESGMGKENQAIQCLQYAVDLEHRSQIRGFECLSKFCPIE